MDTYEVTIETQDRFKNEEGETTFGPVRKANVIIEAKSETEAAILARNYRTPFNNVTVSKL